MLFFPLTLLSSSQILSKSKISNFKNFEGFNNLSLNIKRDFFKKIKKIEILIEKNVLLRKRDRQIHNFDT